MSIETWMKEFYPITAQKAAHDLVDEKDLIAHSLMKWRGLLPDAMKRHGLTQRGATIVDSSDCGISIDDSSCALCERFLVIDNGFCSQCPLGRMSKRGCDSEYLSWKIGRDPKPMVAFLEIALN